jgi:hypothetical protein
MRRSLLQRLNGCEGQDENPVILSIRLDPLETCVTVSTSDVQRRVRRGDLPLTVRWTQRHGHDERRVGVARQDAHDVEAAILACHKRWTVDRR